MPRAARSSQCVGGCTSAEGACSGRQHTLMCPRRQHFTRLGLGPAGEKFGVRGFPTLKWFPRGKPNDPEE